MADLSDEQILKMAMGVKTGDEEADATAAVLQLKAEWETIPDRNRDKLTKRRKMRHNMFRIVKCLTREIEMTPEDHTELLAIKSIIDPQLNNSQMRNWYSFTFHWDIHPRDHTKIITKDRWFAEGGAYEELGLLKPSAFTEQEIS